jgi:N-methylhydantoinase A
MEESVRDQLNVSDGEVQFSRTIDARCVGQGWETPLVDVPGGEIDAAAVEQIVANFHDEYERLNGNRFDALPVMGVTYRVQATVPVDKVTYESMGSANGSGPLEPEEITLRWIYGDEVTALAYERAELRTGDVVEGPAVIREDLSTTQVCPGQVATVGSYGEMAITRSENQ